MANRWRNNENSDRLYFGGAPKPLQMVTAAMKLKDACSLEKSCSKFRQHIKEQRHYFANKVLSSQSHGFSSSHLWMWELDREEGWAPIIDPFELWCWRRLLRVPWTARRSNQSILKEISTEYSLEGLMLKLKLLFFGHLKWRIDSLEKILILGKIEGRRRKGWQRMRWLHGITDWLDMNWSEFQELVMDREPSCAAVHGIAKSWTWLSDWNELKWVEVLHLNMPICRVWDTSKFKLDPNQHIIYFCNAP